MTRAETPPKPPPLPSERKTWQFSMRTMMIGMTGFCLFLVLVTSLPASFSQAISGAIWIAATGWIVTGLFFARGDQQAFCIGAAVVVSSMWSRIGGRFIQGVTEIVGLPIQGLLMSSSEVWQWLQLGIIAVTAVANGWFCVYARRFYERQNNA